MKIEFRIGPNGNPIPLQRIRTIYGLERGDRTRVTVVAATPDLFVSHFETCPNAGEFSGRAKRGD